jgi:hypothetical protein
VCAFCDLFYHNITSAFCWFLKIKKLKNAQYEHKMYEFTSEYKAYITCNTQGQLSHYHVKLHDRQIKVPAFAFTMHTCILHYKKRKIERGEGRMRRRKRRERRRLKRENRFITVKFRLWSSVWSCHFIHYSNYTATNNK